MKIRVFRSGKGDALLLTSGNGENILVDGGVPETYEEHLAATLGKLRDNGEALDLVCVSHIDRDHIGGILEMMDNEVAWRLFEARSATPALRRRVRSLKKPALKRPAEVKAIWHNAFWEKVRRDWLSGTGNGTALDVTDILFRNAMVLAGGRDLPVGENGHDGSINAAKLANRVRFLGQSVGDAIELSRRIGSAQLDVPLNREFGGGFVVRKRNQDPFQLGAFQLTVLGPTTSELKELLKVWNEWLESHESYLKKLQRRHDRDADKLAASDVSDVVAMAREAAIALAGNQAVTPPNLASIILLAENDSRSVLLTGDADDTSIINGLKAAGRLDSNGQIKVNVFKIPHHGAHNSYSNLLARTVLADDYVFCGNGKHDNPEPDIIEGYLKVLLEGDSNHPAAIRDGMKPTFWFNSGPDLAENSKLRKHWETVEKCLNKWHSDFPGRFRHKFMKSGDSFLVK